MKKRAPLERPVDPGFYWLAVQGEPPHLVEVDIESDSHGMFFVRLPADDHRIPLDLWDGALWFGPIAPMDILMTFPERVVDSFREVKLRV